MLKEPQGTLLVIAIIAFTAPLLTSIAPRLRLPALVIEILLGIVVGPEVLDLVEASEPITVLSEIGLATLIFLAGFEIDPQRVKGRPLKLSVSGWVLSVALGLAAGLLLHATGLIRSELFVGLALTTTALGALLPIMRDAGILPTPFGTHMLAIGSVGEFGPIVAVALFLSGQNPLRAGLALVLFAVVAVLAILWASRNESERLRGALAGTLRSSGQLYIRGAMLLIVVMAFVAADLGLDFLLGAFTAGVVFRIVLLSGAEEETVETVEAKLEALAMGFLIPIFFVVTGINFDLSALTSSTRALAELPMFLGLLLIVRGLPSLLYRKELPSGRERMALALFSATGLPLIVAITHIGVESGHMRSDTAAALVGAGMLSIVIFPLVGGSLLDRGRAPAPPRAGCRAMSESVQARVAPSLSLRRARLRESVLDTLWFIPACGAIGAAVFSQAALELDLSRDLDPASVGLTGDRAAFGTVAATVAAAMLTFLGVVFSTTLVAVQLAASQYSPRIVRVFVRSRQTQATLAVFLATFVYALTALVRVETNDEEFVPQVTLFGLVALVFTTVGMFVAFVHGMVRLLRVQYLLRVTARSSHDAIDHSFPPAEAYRPVSAPGPSPDPVEIRNVHPDQPDARGTPRVLQAVDVAGLADAAAWAGGWIEMCIAVGDHAGPGTVVARVHAGSSRGVDADRVRSHMLFGSERTLLQDPAFGLRQLVDIASRALSPAINDPTTAVAALYRVVDLLERIAHRPDPTGWFVDATGTVRVRLMEDDFSRLVHLGLVEVMRYGADAPQVTRAMLGSIDELATMVGPERLPLLDEMRELCRRSIDDAMPPPFADLAGRADRAGLG